MSTKSIIIAACVVGSLAVVGASVVGYGFSVYNHANRMEKSLIAERDNNRNVLSNYGKKVAEAAQVPDMQRDDFIKVINAQMQGRYGPDGSKAVFQMLTEQNASLDTKVYIKIQQIIEAGRNEFQGGQTKMISVKQEYTRVLDSAPRGVIMGLLGFPHINLADFDIVTDDRTETAFSTHKEAPLKLR